MGPKAIFTIIKLVYVQSLRKLVVDAVQSTDTEWDDFGLQLLDKLFGFDTD